MQSDAATVASLRPFYPDAIDTRLVFRIYAWITISAGLYAYARPLQLEALALPLEGIPWGGLALLRTGAAMVVAAGLSAATLGIVDEPRVGRRALVGFAVAHLVVGFLWFLQWHAILSEALPPIVGWAPLLIGSVLLYIGLTAPTTTPVRKIVTGGLFVDREFEATDALRAGPPSTSRSRALQCRLGLMAGGPWGGRPSSRSSGCVQAIATSIR